MTEPTTAAGRALYYIHGSEGMRNAILAIEAEARAAALDEARAALKRYTLEGLRGMHGTTEHRMVERPDGEWVQYAAIRAAALDGE